MRRDPRVAVNVVDPTNAWRIAMVRGRVVEVTTEGAVGQIDRLAKKYLNEESYPFHRLDRVRTTIKIAPEKINEIGLRRVLRPSLPLSLLGPGHAGPDPRSHSPECVEGELCELRRHEFSEDRICGVVQPFCIFSAMTHWPPRPR